VRGKQAVVGAVCLVALAGVLSGCSGTDNADAPASSASSASSGAQDSKGPTPTPSAGQPTPTGATARPADPVLRTYKPVLRDGRAPRPSVSAGPQPFGRAIRYPDGLRLAVTSISQGKVTGQGPGVFLGEPKTEIGLRMSNRSGRSVNLDQVVVTLVYGSERRTSRPVYDDRARDFNGVLRPGRSATATYLFSVPRPQLDDVTMFVDFDGHHTVGRFRGSARG
jgi:hypothetical protein